MSENPFMDLNEALKLSGQKSNVDADRAKAADVKASRQKEIEENANFRLQLYHANAIFRERQRKAKVKNIINLPSYERIGQMDAEGRDLSPMEREMMRAPVQKILTDHRADQQRREATIKKNRKKQQGFGFSGLEALARLSGIPAAGATDEIIDAATGSKPEEMTAGQLRAAADLPIKFVEGRTADIAGFDRAAAHVLNAFGGDFDPDEVQRSNEARMQEFVSEMPSGLRKAYNGAATVAHLYGATGPLRGGTVGLLKAGVPAKAAGPLSLGFYSAISASANKEDAARRIASLEEEYAKSSQRRKAVLQAEIDALKPIAELDPSKAFIQGTAFGYVAGKLGNVARGTLDKIPPVKISPAAGNMMRRAIEATHERGKEAVTEFFAFSFGEWAMSAARGDEFTVSDFLAAGGAGLAMGIAKAPADRGQSSLTTPERGVATEQRGAVYVPGGKDGGLGANPPTPAREGVQRESVNPLTAIPRRIFEEIHSELPKIAGVSGDRAARLMWQSEAVAKARAGELSQHLDAALRALVPEGQMKALRSMFTAEGRSIQDAYRRMATIDSEGRLGLVEMIEGRTKPSTMAERKFVDLVRELISKRGDLFERAGVMVMNGDGTVSAFQNKGDGKIAPRVFSSSWHAMLQQNHPALEPFAERLAEMNGRPVAEAKKFIADQVASIGGSISELSGRQTQAESSREWKYWPAEVVFKGRRIPILESDPALYIRKLVELGSARLGVIETLGQEISPGQMVPKELRQKLEKARKKGDTMLVDELSSTIAGLEAQAPRQDRRPSQIEKSMKAAGGEDAAGMWRRSMRAAHRLPIDNNALLGGAYVESYNGVGPRFMRGMKNTRTLAKSGMLSASAIVNTTEFMGHMRDVATIASRDQTGMKNLMVDLAKTLKDTRSFLKGDAKEANALLQLEMLGAITTDIANYNINPNTPWSSLIKNFSEFTGRVFGHRYINEFQEAAMGVALLNATQRLQANPGKLDSQAFRIFQSYPNVSRLQAKKLASGLGTQAEYDALIATASGRMTSSTLSPGEVSYFEHARVAKNLAWFQRWGLMSARHTFNRAKTMLSEMGRVESNPDLSSRERRIAQMKEAGSFLNHWGGKTTANAAAYLLYSFVTGGRQGFDDAIRSAKEHPIAFIRDSMVYGVFGGVWGGAARMVLEGEGIAALSPPVAMIFMFNDAFRSKGPYRDMDWWEKTRSISGRLLPIHRTAHTVLAATGASDEYLKDLHTAKRSYWKWKLRDTKFGESEAREDEVAEWYRLARKAKQAVQEGAPEEEVRDLLRQAWSSRGMGDKDGESSARRSMLGSRLLTKLDDAEREDLRKNVGDRTWAVLQEHDKIIERFVESNFPAKSKSKSKGRGSVNPFGGGGGGGRSSGNPFR